jgi:hypothetical protein
MRPLRFLLIPLALLALAACASKPVQIATPSGGAITIAAPVAVAPVDPFVSAVQKFVGAVSNFTSADLTWALNDATAKKDVVSIPCWTYLLQVSSQIPGAGGNLPPLGIASALQVIRDGITIGSGIPAPFQAACGALILDTQVRLAVLVGGAAAGVSTAGVAGPAVGALNTGIAAAISAVRVP